MKRWILTPDRYLKESEAKQLRIFTEEKSIVALAKKKKKPVQDWAIIDIALSSGLRASEICNLRLKDLHIGRGESSIFVFKGKGSKDRLVAISDKLKKHLKSFILWKKGIREAVTPESYLFTTERRSKMSLSAIQKRFKKCSKAAGLNSRYSIHSARHTYGNPSLPPNKGFKAGTKATGTRFKQDYGGLCGCPGRGCGKGG